MFLSLLQKTNPSLIDAACFFLERGKIEPDTYVIDLDGVGENAARLGEAAGRSNPTPYAMLKQVGRNPLVAAEVLASGGKRFDGIVAVDWREALTLAANGLPVKHIGHLVQIPSRVTDKILNLKPDYITVYSYEKAAEISEAVLRRGAADDSDGGQKLLLRVCGKDDTIYPGQEGGFLLDELEAQAEKIAALKGVKIAGLTGFPCFLFDEEKKAVLPTENARTVQKAASLLKKAGFDITQINMPSCNTPDSLGTAAAEGATHAEPGHSLTGTSPDNPTAVRPQKTALCYVTEVSQRSGASSFCYGGGWYRRGRLKSALVKTGASFVEYPVKIPDGESIDYYFELPGKAEIGAPVCMCFRTQIFVTRSRVAVVKGLASGRPEIAGIMTATGETIS